MRAADWVVEWAPAPACTGAKWSPRAPAAKVVRNRKSVTGPYLSQQRAIPIPERRTEERGDSSCRGASRAQPAGHRRRASRSGTSSA